MGHKTTEPFKVTCRLADGRMCSTDGLLYLDAILYHAWFAKNAPNVFYGTANGDSPAHFGLPLTQNDNRYAASCGFYTQYSQTIEYWNKRPDFTSGRNFKYLNAKGKVDTKAGELRAYHFPQVIRTISDIEFYGVGTIKKVRELLSYIPAVGKKPSAGWGAVREWVVEPFAHDWSTEGGYGLMRPMPVDEYDPKNKIYQIMECRLRPPYWKSGEGTKPCFIPKVIINTDGRAGGG